MSDQAISEETRQAIIDALDNGDKTQTEIANENDVSQSTVSNINKALSTGRDRGREEGREEGKKEGYEEAVSFMKSDQTEKEEEDEYWCNYCQDEDDEKVMVDYMAEQCPKGHDLSGDW